MSIIRTGSTQKYAEGWQQAFGSKKKTTKRPSPASKASQTSKKAKKTTRKKKK